MDIQKQLSKWKIENIVWNAIGIFSFVYMLNLGFGVVEISPDNVPLVGHIDEFVASYFIIETAKRSR